MVNQADALVAIWNGSSPGTFDVIKKACQDGLTVLIHQFEDA